MKLTKAQIKGEIKKCGRDPVYFIKNYCKISHPEKGLIPFKTYDFQDDLLKDFNDHRFNIVLKARQLGISTIVAGYIAWLLLFRREKSVVVIATKFEVAANLVRKVKSMINHLPEWVRIAKIKINNQTSFELSNGSWIKASSTNESAGRSEALSLLVIDEAAFVDGLEDLWKGIFPTLSCVTGDTLVLTEEGFKKIEDFHKNRKIGDYFEINDLLVWGKTGLEKVSHGYVSPDSDTLKIRTRKGLELEVTPKHPLYKLGNKGGFMEQAQNLKISDKLRVDFGMNIFGNNDVVRNKKWEIVTKDLAYMIGGAVAEGWITGNKKEHSGQVIHISNTDKEFRDVYLKSDVIKNFVVNKTEPHKMYCCSRDLVNLYRDIGFLRENKCDTKVTPYKIFECSREKVSSYLSGLFDGDGSVTSGGIVLSSTSHKLLKETQLLLLNYGIISNIHQVDREKILERERRNKRILPGGKTLQSLRESWRLVIPRSYFKMFADNIGFRITRKQNALLRYAEEFSQNDGKPEVVPIDEIKDTLIKIIEESGQSHRWFGNHGIRIEKALDEKKGRKVNYSWMCKLHNILEENNLLNDDSRSFFDEMTRNKCFWDEIVSIKNSKNKTYDFTVPDTHTFLQNGILGSNTGGRCIALSTPNGVGNWFHETYTKAVTGENDFHHIELPWQVHPERDEEWFEEVTRNLSRRDVAQEHECFAAGTKVYTSFGLQNIENLKEGDLVLTHKGRFRPIKSVRSKLSDNVYSVRTFFNRNETLVTGEHPILTKSKEWCPIVKLGEGEMFCSSPKNIDISEDVLEIDIKKYVQSDFFKIKDDGDQIYLNDRRHKVRHNRNIKVDYDLGYFLGLFLVEGSINKNTISFSFNYLDELNTWVDRLCDIVERVFGYNSFSIYNKNKSGVLCINSVIISKFLQSMIDGNYAYDKRIARAAYEVVNRQFLTGILDGFFEGDGCIKETYDKTTNITSRELIYDLKYISTILGLGRNSIRKSAESKLTTIMGRSVNVREQYTLKMLQTRGIMVDKVSDLLSQKYINEDTSYKNFHNEDENYYLTRFVSRQKVDEVHQVYDLEIEEDHSFTTEHFVAHNCNFNASGDSVVSPEDIDCLRGLVVEPLTRTGFDRNYWIWEEYQPDFSYMVIADVSRGDGADYSAAHVFKIETMEQVAEYQGKPSTDMYANLLASVGREYGGALLVVENNNIGYNVLEKLIEMNYPNLYYSVKSTHEYVDQLQAEYQSNSVPGFTTSPKTRPLIVAKMEEFIRNKIVKLSSTRTVEELSTFIWSNGKAQAQKNKNDDLTMSLAIACWVRDTAITSAVRDVEYNKAMLGSIVVANTKMSNQIPGQIGYRSNLDFSGNSVREQARRQHQMYSWLYKG